MSTWIGLDVSKDTIDVGFYQEDSLTHFKIKNNLTGFRELKKKTPSDSKFVMEATGIYFLKCARFLTKSKSFVCVENPLKIKRFADMSLRRSKTDKKDALLIARYGQKMVVRRWVEPNQDQLEAKEIQSVIDKYTSMAQRLKNQCHAFSNSGINDEFLLGTLKKTINEIDATKKILEKKLFELIDRGFHRELNLITSVSGIGKATACLIISKIGNCSTFQRSGQLTSYFGITPVESYSGTSLNSKGVVSRMGSSKVRAKLYMCAVSSFRSNPQVMAMRKRMKDNGKHNMKIIVAAMNKLVRQVFGVLKSGEPFNPKYL
jgi:transposase